MRIGLFIYNFEHKKTQEGMLNLFLNGYKPICAFAQDWKKLHFVDNGARVGLKDIRYTHPKIIANNLKIQYINISHDDCSEIIKNLNLDIGIILGSRILKENVINSFKIGIINMHPGVLPENRGLDNIKWAILDRLPQSVTTHLISKEIDKGRMIDKKCVNVYPDDTLTEIMIRIQNREQVMMIEALKKIESNIGHPENLKLQELPDGKYHSLVSRELEKQSLDRFQEYKNNYSSIVENYGGTII